jgi:hypothetical protein
MFNQMQIFRVATIALFAASFVRPKHTFRDNLSQFILHLAATLNLYSGVEAWDVLKAIKPNLTISQQY